MRGRASNGFQTLRTTVRLLLPAWLLFLIAALVVHPVSLVALLLANAVAMTAMSRVAGFDHDTRFIQGLARRGVAYFVASSAYAAVVAGLVVLPAWWLLEHGSLPAALALSAALTLSLVCLWRVWPAFALPLLWDDAYPHPDERGSWLSTVLWRSLAFARHMTGEHELFFTCGLPAGLGLLSLAVGALALSGIGGMLSGEVRTVAIVVYAALLAPFAHLLLINRCLHAMLADARGRRQAMTKPVVTADSVAEHVRIPDGIARADLDSTLLCAVHSAQTSLALAALERGADPDTAPSPQHRDQRTPLMLAVTLPDLRLLRALIAKGVDVNRAHGGITPLIAATRDSHDGRPDAVTTLLANGADARMPDAIGNTPLHHAARCAEPIIAALLVDAAIDVDAINAEGMTALGVACANANWNVAAFLLDNAAKPDIEHAQPALLCACAIAEDDPAGVRLLLRHKARVDARGALERTALMTAALSGHARIIEALLGGGASTELADARGTTALMEAARSGSAVAIHALGKRKLDADRVDAGGRSALMIACQSRHAGDDAVRALLALGATRSLVGADGKRALDYAAVAGRWHIVALLDPTYPLPSSLAAVSIDASTAHADHLLDALRFGHWNVANEFVGVVGSWPAAALADLYLDLADSEHVDARTWLRNHGLDVAARCGSDAALLDALVDRLPRTTRALGELVACGVPIGGAGLVARVLAAASGVESVATVRLASDLLARGADWCGCSANHQTALHLAVALGECDLVTTLLDRGADPDARDAQGNTPLHLSLRLEHDVSGAMQRLLIAAGANPEIANANGETALGLALARGEPMLVRWLSWNGWRLPLRRLRDADLPAAAAEGDLDAVMRLHELGVAVDGEDAQGATALVRAAGAGHAALVVHLLAAGADVAHLTRSGVHCLAAAVGARREAVVRTLLAHGIAPDLPIAGGGSCLLVAAALADERIARALLEAGANPNASDEQGTTALQAAAQGAFESGDTHRSRAILDLLLRAGARLDAHNQQGQDALLVLLGARSPPGTRCDAEHLHRLVACLLERGARVDTQDKRGVSALHACALHGLAGCARLLKSHGAPLDLVDGFGRSAADVAVLLGYVDVAAELDGAHAALVPGVRQTLRRPARAPD
jgi:ankyrin repeat protein